MRRLACFVLLTALLASAMGARGSAARTSAIEGRWKTTKATLPELLAAGFSRKSAEAWAGVRVPKTPALDFRKGKVKGLDLNTGRVLSTGTYRVSGSTISIVWLTKDRALPPITMRRPGYLKWSVFRDRLTFSNLPGRKSPNVLTIHPFVRVR
jgi:hypothetical protein